ncbi:MAG: hypothetical protein LIO97_13495 [Tannerellaceae bacterium]|nr:hypothetical protein [Tannerellaceae bacterium]
MTIYLMCYYITDRQQQHLLLDGITYSSTELDKLLYLATAQDNTFLIDLYHFLQE